ncbi:hypothetical protein EBBID32_1090 [Sphingobium indicum BiD32]|uniref:Uncharacterized protein n=2 Tax=Sphingobium indicum TaxID=332055 RepID=N1MFP5_9SPHN|nr:hypothetical protein EBBID32_1090 [Sphingobium indicum BiD32]
MNAFDVAAYVETLLPPIADIMQTDSARAPDDLAPYVTLPVIYVHIIIQGFRSEVLRRQHDQMKATIAKGELKPKAEMTEDETEAVAVHLATEANDRTFAPIEGACALWKAAAIMAVAHMPKETVLSALDGIHAMTRADVVQAVGIGATKQ